MLALMRKPRTKRLEPVVIRGEKLYAPAEKINAILVLLRDPSTQDQDTETIPAADVFKDLHAKYGKQGSALRGARLKEDMTQTALSTKLKITQSDLSKMEHGKRPIGKKMSKRLADVLNIDYRVFL